MVIWVLIRNTLKSAFFNSNMLNLDKIKTELTMTCCLCQIKGGFQFSELWYKVSTLDGTDTTRGEILYYFGLLFTLLYSLIILYHQNISVSETFYFIEKNRNYWTVSKI